MNQEMIIKVFIELFAYRSFLFLALLLNFSLFAYAVYQPEPMRFATAGMFSITVFIPVLKMTVKAKSNETV